MAEVLGPWVRLEGISISQLPSGGKGVAPSNRNGSEKYNDGSAATGTPPSLRTFVEKTLEESIPFIDGVAPKSGRQPTWKVKGSPKKYAASEAPVHIYERVVSGKDLDKVEGMSQFSADRKDETWFCRRSCHRNAQEQRTASWEEFVRCFKDHHAESEDAFTPAIIGARQAMGWDTSGMEVDVLGERWTNVSVVVEEMKHKIDPKPLKNRIFPVIQISAMLSRTSEFIVVSIPINDFDRSPYAEFSKDKSLVMAAYASIERIRVLPSNGEVEWIMATASNAGGVLPQWMQNLAVPGAVAKDVEMFLSWIPSQRTTKDGKPAPISKLNPNDKGLPAAPYSGNEAPSPISKAGDKLATNGSHS
ncbi:hypothetical protein BKA65DRAFT_492634 [Rhexocercosporidium sp. MPI-PUGE-AT-0058]|nr:hypothetical protein BKA65DRAFT_492634 [Rhexocercosporidium sp. MPI-PUGE-AT-0058]